MKINLGSEEVELDTKIFEFNEATINQFLQKYGAQYSYYMEKHADAKFLSSKLEDRYDALKAEKFQHYRSQGGSDKLAEMKSCSDKEVQEALEHSRIGKRNVDLIWGHLRSMDKSHEDAMQICYNMRKELSSMFNDTVKR